MMLWLPGCDSEHSMKCYCCGRQDDGYQGPLSAIFIKSNVLTINSKKKCMHLDIYVYILGASKSTCIKLEEIL